MTLARATTNDSNQTDLVPVDIIRTETVLSKLPVHNLAKRGRVNIHITSKNEHGEVELEWKVSPNPAYGEPRQLAYKLDTIVINQKIDELGRPLPKVIKIGSLNELCREMGSQKNELKRAFQQNATTAITARLAYKGKDGKEHTLEATFTRYSVIFTGKKLPGGAKADAVYLILNEPFWEVLNYAPDRPLDFTYLKVLAPAPQRFYELASFQIFATLKYRLAEAKIRYSEYCLYAAQQRYYDYDHMKKQMYKIHRPHVTSGYITKVRYESTVDQEGNPDWWMFYVPGPKAVAEYKAFHKKKAATIMPQEQGKGEAAQPEVPDQSALELAQYFQKTFFGVENGAPAQKEIAHAAGLIQQHGFAKAKYVVEFCHKVAPETNFKPQVFGAVLQYTDRTVADYDKAQARQKAQAAIAACTHCDSSGFIFVTDTQGRSVARKCSHERPPAAEKTQGPASRARFTFSRHTQTA